MIVDANAIGTVPIETVVAQAFRIESVADETVEVSIVACQSVT